MSYDPFFLAMHRYVLPDSKGAVSFAWFGCPDGYELVGSLQAHCIGSKPSETTEPWQFSSGEVPYCSQCKPGTMRVKGELGNPAFSDLGEFDQYRIWSAEGTSTLPTIDEKKKDQRAVCSVCAAQTYTHAYGATECWKCPEDGVICSDGVMKVSNGWWFDAEGEITKSAEADGCRALHVCKEGVTNMRECAAAGACLPSIAGGGAVVCVKGYTGALVRPSPPSLSSRSLSPLFARSSPPLTLFSLSRSSL